MRRNTVPPPPLHPSSPPAPLLNRPVVDICGVISGMSTNSPMHPRFPIGVDANTSSNSFQLPEHSYSINAHVSQGGQASEINQTRMKIRRRAINSMLIWHFTSKYWLISGLQSMPSSKEKDKNILRSIYICCTYRHVRRARECERKSVRFHLKKKKKKRVNVYEYTVVESLGMRTWYWYRQMCRQHKTKQIRPHAPSILLGRTELRKEIELDAC